MENYQRIWKIDEGGNVQIFKVVEKDTKRVLALKIIKTKEKDKWNKSIEEMKKIIEWKHENIVEIIKYDADVRETNGIAIYYAFIIMELGENSILKEFKNKKGYSEEELLKIIYEVINAIEYAHERNTPHLDIKPQNIFRFNNKVKVADWGSGIRLKTKYAKTMDNSKISFTELYYSPEILKMVSEEDAYTKINLFKCDIYTIGTIILELLGIDKILIEKMKRESVEEKKLEVFLEKHLNKIELKNKKKWKTLLMNLLNYDYESRFDIKQSKKFVEDLMNEEKFKKEWEDV